MWYYCMHNVGCYIWWFCITVVTVIVNSVVVNIWLVLSNNPDKLYSRYYYEKINLPPIWAVFFYSVSCNFARISDNALARSSIKPFRFALVKSAAYFIEFANYQKQIPIRRLKLRAMLGL